MNYYDIDSLFIVSFWQGKISDGIKIRIGSKNLNHKLWYNENLGKFLEIGKKVWDFKTSIMIHKILYFFFKFGGISQGFHCQNFECFFKKTHINKKENNSKSHKLYFAEKSEISIFEKNLFVEIFKAIILQFHISSSQIIFG